MDIEIVGRFHQRWCNEFEPGLPTVVLGEGGKGSVDTEDSDQDQYRIAARCRLEIHTDSDHRAHPISARGCRENDSLVLSGSPISLCKHIINVKKRARKYSISFTCITKQNSAMDNRVIVVCPPDAAVQSRRWYLSEKQYDGIM